MKKGKQTVSLPPCRQLINLNLERKGREGMSRLESSVLFLSKGRKTTKPFSTTTHSCSSTGQAYLSSVPIHPPTACFSQLPILSTPPLTTMGKFPSGVRLGCYPKYPWFCFCLGQMIHIQMWSSQEQMLYLSSVTGLFHLAQWERQTLRDSTYMRYGKYSNS